MADVKQQSRHYYQLEGLVYSLLPPPVEPFSETHQDCLCEIDGTETVGESSVGRTRKNIGREPELADAAKPRECSGIDDRAESALQFWVTSKIHDLICRVGDDMRFPQLFPLSDETL
jgi:hypothetical protein